MTVAYIDGDTAAIKIFSRYKEIMNLEFSDPEVTKTIEIINDETGIWYLCPECIEGFQSQSQDALLLCPNCKTKLNNPICPSGLYKNQF